MAQSPYAEVLTRPDEQTSTNWALARQHKFMPDAAPGFMADAVLSVNRLDIQARFETPAPNNRVR
jgi:hypothetical protein